MNPIKLKSLKATLEVVDATVGKIEEPQTGAPNLVEVIHKKTKRGLVQVVQKIHKTGSFAVNHNLIETVGHVTPRKQIVRKFINKLLIEIIWQSIALAIVE